MTGVLFKKKPDYIDSQAKKQLYIFNNISYMPYFFPCI